MNSSIIIEQEIMTVVSNAAYLIPAFYLFTVELFVESFSYFNLTLWSSLYHLCFNCGYCIIENRRTLQFMDFFASFASIGMIVVYFIDIYPRKYKIILQCIIGIIVLFFSYLDFFNTMNFVIALSIFIPLGTIYFLIYLMKWIKEKKYSCSKNICKSKLFNNCLCNFIFDNRKSPFHPADILLWIIGILFFILGFVLNVIPSIPYWIGHSLWHLFTGIAAIFIFTVYNKKNILMTCMKKCIKCPLSKYEKDVDPFSA